MATSFEGKTTIAVWNYEYIFFRYKFDVTRTAFYTCRQCLALNITPYGNWKE